MSLSKRLRYEILNRDNFTCRYCGGQPPDVALTVDHVLPVTLGGSDEPSNLCAACKDCNAGKSSVKPGSPMLDQVADDAARWARAIAYAVSARSSKIEELEADFEQFDRSWCSWTVISTKEHLWRPEDWRQSVEVWLKRGLTIEMLCHYIPKAMGQDYVKVFDMWRYYCGIIWKVVTELDVEATGLVRELDDLDALDHVGDLKALVF